jgi:hypothetical protein
MRGPLFTTIGALRARPGIPGFRCNRKDDMRRYEVLAKAATAATAVVGLAAFGLVGSASAAASVGAVHNVTGEYNLSTNGSLACPPGQPLATGTCYMVGTTGTFSYTATSGTTNVIVPVTDGVAGTNVQLPASEYISYISCTSGPNCIALGSNTLGGTFFYWLDSGKVVKTVTVPAKGYYWAGLSCGSATYCVASGSKGVGSQTVGAVAVMSNGVVSLHRVATVIGNGVSCYAPTACLVVGTSHQGSGTAYGTLVEVKGGVTGLVHATSSESLAGVTCGWQAGICRATGSVAAGNGGFYPATAIIKGTTAAVTKLAGDASPGDAVCPAVGQCVEFGVVNPNSKGEHAFVAVATGGAVGTSLTVPGLADVYSVSCPQVGACDGVGSLLHGPHGDYSLATFTLRY